MLVRRFPAVLLMEFKGADGNALTEEAAASSPPQRLLRAARRRDTLCLWLERRRIVRDKGRLQGRGHREAANEKARRGRHIQS